MCNLTVILHPEERNDPEFIRHLLVSNASGNRLPLHQLASISLEPSREMIRYDGTRRRQIVTCNTDGREASAFVGEVKKRIAEKVSLPAWSWDLVGWLVRYGFGSVLPQPQRR